MKKAIKKLENKKIFAKINTKIFEKTIIDAKISSGNKNKCENVRAKQKLIRKFLKNLNLGEIFGKKLRLEPD
jgi:hypothetical protein